MNDEEQPKQDNNSWIKKIRGEISEWFKSKIKAKIWLKILTSPTTWIVLGIIAGIAGIVALGIFLNQIKGDNSKKSKEAKSTMVYYSSDITEETSANRMIVDSKSITENGAYVLTYEFRDENGNLYSEEQALENIKKDLQAENEIININNFSDSELKVIGALLYNGMDIKTLNEAELKALVIFVKTDIAVQSFDLRKEDQEILCEDLLTSDEIYGTLELYKTTIDTDGKVIKEKLQYLPYEEFDKLIEAKDLNVLNKFTIDEEECLIIAKWNTRKVEYKYLSQGGTELSAEDMQKIPEEYNLENEDKTTIVESQPINYKKFLSRYIINYEFLSDLLITTKNVDFCLEMAQLSLNGKFVINVDEQTTVTKTDSEDTFTQSSLLYDYVDYDIYEADISWEPIEFGSGSPGTNSILTNDYGWSPSLKPIKATGNSSGGTSTYQWENEKVKYRLTLNTTLTNSSWILYEEKKEYPDTATESKSNEFINIYGKHITEAYDEYTIDEDYTDLETITYKRITNATTISHSYNFEIAEIDSWYMKYKREEKTSEIKENSLDSSIDEKGKYSAVKEIRIEKTNDSSIINNDKHVADFIKVKENLYKKSYSKDVLCKVTSLTVEQRAKTDILGSTKTLITKYKFKENEEEETDTTEGTLKNVEFINNVPSYTAVDENGNPETGFLSIYDSYKKQNEDLFLKDDSETLFFELLEETPATANKVNTIKYLLYVYDGIDRGVTTLRITIIDIDEFLSLNGDPTEHFIKAWESGSLWMYETGQTDDFPTRKLSPDEAFYIVYEDGSGGHNNVGYGLATFLSRTVETAKVIHPKYGPGIYNWKEEFAAEAIMVEEFYEGKFVDKIAVDAIFSNEVLPRFIKKVDNYLETNLPDYYEKFTDAQKDALISICYQYGNIEGFKDIYLSALNEDGTVDAEKLKSWGRFNFTGTINDRKYANWLLFTEGKYIDRAGNEIIVSTVLSKAKEIHDYMSDPEHLYYYCLSGDEKSKMDHINAGITQCGLLTSWENSKDPTIKGNRLTCCATYVSWVLRELELIDGFSHNVRGLEKLLIEKEWIPILSYDELQPGDVGVIDTDSSNGGNRDHATIFVGDDTWYDAGCNKAIHSVEPYAVDWSAQFVIGYRKP